MSFLKKNIKSENADYKFTLMLKNIRWGSKLSNLI